MTVVRYNHETMEYDLVDSRTRAVIEDGYSDRQAATEVAATYNTDED